MRGRCRRRASRRQRRDVIEVERRRGGHGVGVVASRKQREARDQNVAHTALHRPAGTNQKFGHERGVLCISTPLRNYATLPAGVRQIAIEDDRVARGWPQHRLRPRDGLARAPADAEVRARILANAWQPLCAGWALSWRAWVF